MRGIEPLKHAIVFLLFLKLFLQILGAGISFRTKKVIGRWIKFIIVFLTHYVYKSLSVSQCCSTCFKD